MTKNQLIEQKFKKDISICRHFRCTSLNLISFLVGLELDFETDVDTLYSIIAVKYLRNRLKKGTYSSDDEKDFLEKRLVKVEKHLEEYVL